MSRTGVANLPLHGGKAPRWLFKRMEGLPIFTSRSLNPLGNLIFRIIEKLQNLPIFLKNKNYAFFSLFIIEYN